MSRRADPAANTPQRIQDGERATRAVQLRIQGESFDAIAGQLGYPSGNAARLAVRRLLARREAAAADELRAVESDRLDMLWRKAVSLIQRDPSPAAIAAAVRVSERRSRLLGLDAPAELRVAPATSPADVVQLRDEFLELTAGRAHHEPPITTYEGMSDD
ncbi:MAG: hypothetical protein QM658_04045 [Gordonia sp. (in: high G+C Gram-positive bacteria)]